MVIAAMDWHGPARIVEWEAFDECFSHFLKDVGTNNGHSQSFEPSKKVVRPSPVRKPACVELYSVRSTELGSERYRLGAWESPRTVLIAPCLTAFASSCR